MFKNLEIIVLLCFGNKILISNIKEGSRTARFEALINYFHQQPMVSQLNHRWLNSARFILKIAMCKRHFQKRLTHGSASGSAVIFSPALSEKVYIFQILLHFIFLAFSCVVLLEYKYPSPPPPFFIFFYFFSIWGALTLP